MGAIGSGKSNALYHLVSGIKNNMTENDAMIVFDTKGDYISKFYAKNDSVIALDRSGDYSYKTWNIFKDIEIEKKEMRYLAADEIISTLFQPSIMRTQNPFFPKAAKDVVLAIVINMLENSNDPSNFDLKNALFNRNKFNEIIQQLKSDDKWSWILDYLPEKTQQAAGVKGEIYQVMRPILQGPFGERGDFSVRKFVRDRQGRALFLEYSVNTSMVLKPLYSVLYDLAIKEVLSSNSIKGRIFFIIDEFSLLPYLQYIENGINFGRDRGARFVISAQNMNQIVDIYGEAKAKSIVSGVGTLIVFRLYDKLSREMVSSKYGQAIKKVSWMSRKQQEGYKDQVILSNVIEDADLSILKTGESIICSPTPPPFMFKFTKYHQ